MSKKTIAFILVPIILIGSVLLMNFLAGKKELPPERPTPEVKNYVKVQEIKYDRIPVEIEAFGRVGSSQQVDLVAEVGGKLLQGGINLKEGQNFRKGQLICRIYNVEQRLNLLAAKSNYLNILASALPDLKIDYPDNYNHWIRYFDAIDIEKDLAPLPKARSSKEKTFLATRNITGEYYTIKSQEENLKKYSIYAPYGGSVLSVDLEIGSVVNPGSVIATIIRTDKLELEVPIELRDINYVKTGAQARIVREGEVTRSWEGTVVRKADVIDPNTQSVRVYIAIKSKGNDIYDGLYLKAIIPGNSVDQGMRIDRNIVRNKNQVFVVEDNRLVAKEINILKISQNEIVFNGLDRGQLLVVDAPANASNNMVVDILN